MNAELRKRVYWIVQDVYEQEKAACSDCNDIDCGKNYVSTLLQKKYRLDVIDHKSCLKAKKENAAELKKILELPFFKKENTMACEDCKKEFKRTLPHWPLECVSKGLNENGTYTVRSVCKPCSKKYPVIIGKKKVKNE